MIVYQLAVLSTTTKAKMLLIVCLHEKSHIGHVLFPSGELIAIREVTESGLNHGNIFSPL
jgi:hypothetical protein